MKKLLATLLLATFAPVFASAAPSLDLKKSVSSEDLGIKELPAKLIAKECGINSALLLDKSETFQADSKYHTLRAGWPFPSYTIGADITPIVYEPNSKFLFVTLPPSWKWDQTNHKDTTWMRVGVSKDMGATWSPRVLLESYDTLYVAPSLSVVNPDPANSDLNNFIFSVVTVPNFSLKNAGKNTNALSQQIFVGGNRYKVDHFGPGGDKNNYSFDYLKIQGAMAGKAARFISGDRLFHATNSTADNGVYAMVYGEYVAGDDPSMFSAVDKSKWAYKNFRPASENSTYNSTPLFSFDPNGNLYGIVNNEFKGFEDKKTIAYVKSVASEGSLEWKTDWEKLPDDVFNKFLAEKAPSADLNSVTSFFTPFKNNAMVATGVDEFSYLGEYFIQDKASNTLYYSGICEVYKKGGKWGINEVDKFMAMDSENKLYTPSITSLTTYATKNSAGANDTIIRAYVGPKNNEFEIARTADGKYLVAKWIEEQFDRTTDGYRDYSKTEVAATELMFKTVDLTTQTTNDFPIKSYIPTDIYLSWREIDGGKWSTPVNVTRDWYTNRNTSMPQIIPDIKRVPIISSYTTEDYPKADEDITVIKNLNDKYYMQMYGDGYNDIVFACFDATKEASSVENESVKGKNSVYPNPANNSVYVAFEGNGDVTIDIYNMMGVKVMTAFNGQANGIVNFDASSLVNGTYVCKVMSNGSVTSSMFTVSR
jgi:hypothetical protein